MKKLALFTAILAFTLVSCKTTSSSTNNTTEETENKPTETSPKKPTDMKSLTYPTE